MAHGHPDERRGDAAQARAEFDELAEGTILGGKYALVRRLAAGGMGVVYEAKDLVQQELVAVKVLHAAHASQPRLVRRFIREAKVVRSLESEHIVAVYDSGDAGGKPFFVMELLRGQDLRELLAEFPCLPVPRAAHIVSDVCAGLAAAHAAGLIHRDLKPANIFVTRRPDGREIAKVLDFGVAKLRDASDTTGEGTLIGTVGYMAPEQIVSGKDVDQRTDVYALGVILYEALAGARVHQGEKAEVLYHAVYVDATPLADLRPNLPQGLAAVVARAMARAQEDRYSTVGEFSAALRPFATAIGYTSAADAGATEVQGRSATTWDESTNGGSQRGRSSSHPRVSATEPFAWRRRWRGALLTLLAAAAASVGFERSTAAPPDTVPAVAETSGRLEPLAPAAQEAGTPVPAPGLDVNDVTSSTAPQKPVAPSGIPVSSRSPARILTRPAPPAAATAMALPGAMFDAKNPYATP